MPTTSATSAKSFRGARLIKFLHKARRRCRATYRSMQAGRLLLRSLPAVVMVSMLVPPPVAAQAPAGNSVAAEVQSSASGKLKKLDRKCVVEGKSVSVRVDLGCRGIIKKKNKKNNNVKHQ